MQCLFFQMMLPVRDRDSSPECGGRWEVGLLSTVPRAAFQTRDICLVFGGNRHQLLQSHRPRNEMAFSGCTGQDLTMVLGGISGYSHQAVPHHECISSSPSFIKRRLSLSVSSLYHILAHCNGASICARRQPEGPSDFINQVCSLTVS